MASDTPRLRRQLISLAQAAEETDISPRTLRRYIADGRLPAYRVGPRMVRVNTADLDEMVGRIPTAER